MTHITRLQAENVKRLKAVTIDPKGNMVVIGGKNGQGKTSVLDSIMYALGGKETLPSQPLRKGQTKGKAELTLSNGLIVTRKFSKKGAGCEETTELEIRDGSGTKLASPQALLDKLCSQLAFDPLAFSRLGAKQQADSLRNLVGLDFTKADEERARYFTERTDINRQVKQLDARLESLPGVLGELPAAEVSIAALTDKLGKAEQRNKLNAGDRAAVQQVQNRVDSYQQELNSLMVRVRDLESNLAEEKKRLVEVTAAAAELKDSDTAGLRQQIKDAEQTNQLFRQQAERTKVEKEADIVRRKAAALTERIEAIDAGKAKSMETAKFPVAGLGFDAAGEGITLNSLPFSQASAAEQLRVSIAIGFQLNPGLPIALIRDGSLLDENSLKLAAEITDQHKGQLWIERVGDGDEVTVLIEDGQVIEAE